MWIYFNITWYIEMLNMKNERNASSLVFGVAEPITLMLATWSYEHRQKQNKNKKRKRKERLICLTIRELATLQIIFIHREKNPKHGFNL